MAAVSFAQAQAARTDARRLREEERRLREQLVRLRHAQQRLIAATSVLLRDADGLRSRPLPSPWSGLFWSRPGAELEGVLVPLD